MWYTYAREQEDICELKWIVSENATEKEVVLNQPNDKMISKQREEDEMRE